jgi:hypothetical protein
MGRYQYKYRHSGICPSGKKDRNEHEYVLSLRSSRRAEGREGYAIRKHACALAGSDDLWCCCRNFFRVNEHHQKVRRWCYWIRVRIVYQ